MVHVQSCTSVRSALKQRNAVLFMFNFKDNALCFLALCVPFLRVVLLFQALMGFVFRAFGLPRTNLVKPIKSIFSWIKFPPKNKYMSERALHVKTRDTVQDKREHTARTSNYFMI